MKDYLHTILLAPLALAMCVLGKEASLSKDMLRIDEFLQGYYLHPQPEAVPEMLLLLDKVAKTFKNGEMDGMEAPIIGFFSEIFRADTREHGQCLFQIVESVS